MPTTPNYNETTLAGQTWQRAHHIVIENPYNKSPRMTFGEQKVYVMGDKTITDYVGQQLSVTFDSNNPKHVALYTAINDIYVELREIRDTPAPAAPVIPD